VFSTNEIGQSESHTSSLSLRYQGSSSQELMATFLSLSIHSDLQIVFNFQFVHMANIASPLGQVHGHHGKSLTSVILG
jgi:hypothetical protein